MADSNFADVSLLLHCNGTDGATTFADDGPIGHTVTAVGGAQVDTAQSKFGGASALTDASGDRLTVPYAASLGLATGDFTLECWVRFSLPANSVSSAVLLAQTHSSYYHPWFLIANAPGGPYYTLSLVCYSDANALVVNITHGTQLYKDIWYHVAATRSGNTFRVFVNGASPVSASTAAALKSSSDAITVGALGSYGSRHRGWLDDIRITKGVARYTAAFAPPSAEFEGGGLAGYLQIGGPLGAPTLRGTAGQVNGRVALAGPLGAPALRSFSDFTRALAAEPGPLVFYFDLVTPDGDVRVPVSSWQGTLQVGGASYAGAVVPACGQWIDALAAATRFKVWREATTADGGALEVLVFDFPLQTLQIDRGPTNYTASLSGYGQEIAAPLEPEAIYDRALQDVRSVSVYGSGQRVRCALDWLLRPGMVAYVDGAPLVVAYMNLYATMNGRAPEAYMDVGERVV